MGARPRGAPPSLVIVRHGRAGGLGGAAEAVLLFGALAVWAQGLPAYARCTSQTRHARFGGGAASGWGVTRSRLEAGGMTPIRGSWTPRGGSTASR